MDISRRGVVAGLTSALVGTAAAAAARIPISGLELGAPRPFSFDALKTRARTLAAAPYRPPASGAGAALAALDYDAMDQIRYRADAALWKDAPGDGAVEFFHLGRYARTPVAIQLVEKGQARPILYSEMLFEIPAGHPARALPPAVGFAGFRVMNIGAPGDWLAFQGASYFRAAAPFNQYGLSARGLAIDTAAPHPEEFPIFTNLWLEHDADGHLVVSALLESESVVGAYRIAHRRSGDNLVQEVEVALNFRKSVEKLGVAPLTSMFWYGQPDRTQAVDWRPQIHDSDGLALWTGAGERLWRPLANPPRVITNAFADLNPRGFGLMQRDRVFGDYQDDGVFYDRRPSAWVEPLGDWGAGSVQLVELPTTGETDDNIVAFWTPAAPVKAGDAMSLRYRLHWCDEEPTSVGVARVVATREGRAGRPGQTPTPGARKFVVDFEGGRLADLNRQSGVEAVVACNVGEPTGATAFPVVGTQRWRLMFDVAVAGGATVDMRAYLRLGAESLSETWTYQVFG
jgi:glucans biosynthesis protein